RAEQGEKFAGKNLERHPLDRGGTGEAFAHTVETHQRAGRGVRPWRERLSRIPPTSIVAHAAIPHVATLTARDAGLNTVGWGRWGMDRSTKIGSILVNTRQLSVRATASRQPAHL